MKDLPSAVEEILAALLDAFDRQHWGDEAAQLVARHLALDHPPESIIATLAHALLCEDAGFHAYQILEAGVCQFREWADPEPKRHIMIAVVRYLAAHAPTERALGCKPRISRSAYHAVISCMRMPDRRRTAQDG